MLFPTLLRMAGENRCIPQNKQINNRGRSAILAHDMGCDNGGCLFARFVVWAARQDSAGNREIQKKDLFIHKLSEIVITGCITLKAALLYGRMR